MRIVLRYLDILYFPALVLAGFYIYRSGPAFLAHDVVLPPMAAGSMLLFCGLVLRSWYWHRLLARLGTAVPPTVSVASQLKPVLLKFIPGKIAAFAGRAAILFEAGVPAGQSIVASLAVQALNVATGLLLGVAGVVLLGGEEYRELAITVLLVLGAGVAATAWTLPVPKPLRSIHLRGRHLRVPERVPPLLDVVLLAILCWLLIGGGFCLFFLAIGVGAGLLPLLMQPAANGIGILAFVAPSGLGVREAVGVWYLTLADVPLAFAVRAMILARFWTVAIEIAATCVGALCHRRARRSRSLATVDPDR